jgi:hypothetical protein
MVTAEQIRWIRTTPGTYERRTAMAGASDFEVVMVDSVCHGLSDAEAAAWVNELVDHFERLTQERDTALRDLAISRAATDKTRVEADAVMGQIPRWREIESAPKDGTSILVATKDQGLVLAYWCDEIVGEEMWLCADSHEDEEVHPTHWQPLPEAPKEP